MGTARTSGTVLVAAMVVAGALACGKRALEPGGGGGMGRIDSGVAGSSGAGAAAGIGGSVGIAGGQPSPGPQRINGAACSLAVDCQSGFCVDGVCCNNACTEPCRNCGLPETMGTCVAIAAGGTPRTAGACPAEPVSTCGLDGKCDGAGGCRRHVLGTLCAPGTCLDGTAVVGSRWCDGKGGCRAGATIICVPFACNAATGTCFDACTSDAQCTARPCVDGTCSRPPASHCQSNTQCASGFCVEGVCCNTACADPCTSCALPNRAGTCSARSDCPAQDAGLD